MNIFVLRTVSFREFIGVIGIRLRFSKKHTEVIVCNYSAPFSSDATNNGRVLSLSLFDNPALPRLANEGRGDFYPWTHQF